MKKLYCLFSLIVMLSVVEASFSQPTIAMDFTMNDCATGQTHNLYNILDSGNVVIMEFFMINCPPCIDAGKAIDSMYKEIKLTCPNVRFFQTSFNNSDKCGAVFNWADSNNFSSVPFDSGAAQISYYGFFGMPTVAVAAGNSHKLIYLLTSGGFADSDTAIIADSIKQFCASNPTEELSIPFHLSIFPKPASENFTVSLAPPKEGILKIELLNVFGQRIKTLAEEKANTNGWKRKFPSGNLPKGIYFLRIQMNNSVQTEKLIIQ